LTHNPEDPIVVVDHDDDDDDNNNDYDHDRISSPTARQSQRSQHSGMVQWSSSEYENNVVTSSEEKWVVIQTHWIETESMRNQAKDVQVCALLDRFNECLGEVHDDGSLAQGSTSFLSNKWKGIEARANACWTDTSGAHFLGHIRHFGGLLGELENIETLYGAIVDYRGTASDDE
jgi:hypothetical protein